MVIPARARAEARIGQGDVVLVEPEGDGRIVLIRLERPKPRQPAKARLMPRKGKHPVLVGGPRVTRQQIRQIPMTYLLDVNALLAAIIRSHPDHARADAWVQSRKLAVCPLSELGFLRISTHPKAYNVQMNIARRALRDFLTAQQVEFISANLPALKAAAGKSGEVTDAYLSELAARHGAKLATLDAGIKHTAVELIR
jgi:toxin-antitoxin system PIN domain toxin